MSAHRSSSHVTAAVVAVTVVVVAVIAASTTIAVTVEDTARATALIVPLIGLVPVLIGFLTLVSKVDSIGNKVEEAADVAHKLANGGGDAKLREVIYQVLRDDLVDPKAKLQVEADRRRSAAEAAQRVLEDRDA